MLHSVHFECCTFFFAGDGESSQSLMTIITHTLTLALSSAFLRFHTMFHPQRQCRLHDFQNGKGACLQSLYCRLYLPPNFLRNDWLLGLSFRFLTSSAPWKEVLFQVKCQVKKHKAISILQLVVIK